MWQYVFFLDGCAQLAELRSSLARRVANGLLNCARKSNEESIFLPNCDRTLLLGGSNSGSARVQDLPPALQLALVRLAAESAAKLEQRIEKKRKS